MPKVQPKPEKKYKVKIVAKQEVTYIQTIEMSANDLRLCKDVLDSERAFEIDGLFSDWINQHDVYDAALLEVEEFEPLGAEARRILQRHRAPSQKVK